MARSAKRADSRPLLRVALRIRVAVCAGKPVKDAGWVSSHVKAANRILAAHRIQIDHQLDRFRPAKCELLTRRDRHALARHVIARPAVTVLVMQRVRDLDVPDYNLMGVHWRYRGAEFPGRRWIFITARARPPVLAHELAHFFGLPHDRRGGNLMAPGPSDPIYRRAGAERPKPFRPLLTRRQGRRLRAAILRDAATPVR